MRVWRAMLVELVATSSVISPDLSTEASGSLKATDNI